MKTKRDKVNRVNGLIYLPIDGSRLVEGDRVTLRRVREHDIFPDVVKDPMEMREPVNGDAAGDAIFDAMEDSDPDSVLICDASLPFSMGALVLSKVVAGQGFDPATQFNIKVSLNGEAFRSYALGQGQSITIDNIMDDTPYEVVEELTQEQVDAGYALDFIENARGLVDTAGPIDVVIHNTYERPQVFSSLIVAADVQGTGYDADKVFKVAVQFGEPVDYSVDGGEPIATASKIYIARLRCGQSVTLGHIIVGATYSVVAVPLSPQDIEDGYEYSSVTGGSGSIVRDAVATATVNYAYYGDAGSLIVAVSVDNPEEGKLLHVVIALSRVVNYSVNGGSPLDNGSSVCVAELRHGESVTIANIPNGTSYAVTPAITEAEVASGYSPDTSEGTYPRQGTIVSKNSPERVTVRFAKVGE